MICLLVCGPVGDGKSTLIDSLLRETGTVEGGQAADEAESTSSMVAGAQRCDVAVLVADARAGLQPETRRQLAICRLMGIAHLVLVANKLDLVGWRESEYRRFARDLSAFCEGASLPLPQIIPASALHGDNIAKRSAHAPWFKGPTLLEFLASVQPRDAVRRDQPPLHVTDQIEATVIWFDDAPLLPGRRYELKLGAVAVEATVRRLMHRVEVDSLKEVDALRLEKNDIGRCEIALERPLACDRYADRREAGAFRLVDRMSSATCGAGIVTVAETKRVRWQDLDVTRQARAEQKGQTPRVVWFTGLSGAGKSTIANAVEKALFSRGMHSYLLDGDNVRHGLSRDLGFSDADRVENIRRVGEVAKLMVDAGLIVLVAFISPFRADRRMVRELFQPGEFLEVYVSTPLEVCESRDRKGLYRLAREGRLPHFTGISAPYEPPRVPELSLNTAEVPLEQCVQRVLRLLAGSPAFLV